MQLGYSLFSCVKNLYGTKEKVLRSLIWGVLLIHVFLRARWSYFFLSHALRPHLQYVGLLLLVDVLLPLSVLFSLLYFKRNSLYLVVLYSVFLLVLAYFTWGFDAVTGVILLATAGYGLYKKMQMPVQPERAWRAFLTRLFQVVVLLSFFVNVAFFIALHA
jgi:hypothetical protein